MRSTYTTSSRLLALLLALALAAAACGGGDDGSEQPDTTAATTTAAPTTTQATAAPTTTQAEAPAPDASDQPSEPVTLDWWMIGDEPLIPVWEGVVESFEAANPNISVNLTLFPNEAYKTAIEVALASDEPPDVFFNWPGEDTARLVRDGLVANLDAYADQHGWNDELASGVVSAYRIDNHLYGLPWSLNAKFWFYNTAIFEEHGLTVPESFDELLALCGLINDAGITPASFGNSERWQGVHYLSTLNQKEVPDDVRGPDYALAAADGELFTHPGYAKALSRLLDLVEAECYHPGVNSTDPGTAWASFSSGEVAMTYAGTWAFGIFNDAGFEGQYGLFPMPATDGPTDQSVLLMGPDGIEMAAKSDNLDEAALLMDHIINRDNQQILADESGRLVVNLGVDSTGASPEVRFALGAVATAGGAALWLDVGLEASVAEAYLNGIQEVISGAKTPEEVVASIRETALDAKASLGG